MTKAKAKTAQTEPALFGADAAPVQVREGGVKKNTNDPPTTTRPTAPKSQAVAKIESKPPTNALSALAEALKNPALDPAKMRELFQLYQETEGKQQFHEALLRIDFPAINRDGQIPVSGGKALRFASFENVHKAVMPLLKREGFRMSFAPMPGANGEGLVVECRLIRGTYEEKCIVPISVVPASRAMNSQQAIGAAIKYASRYGMMYLLNLYSEAPEDRDTDANVAMKATGKKDKGEAQEPGWSESVPKITPAQAADLKKKIKESGADEKKFCEFYAIDSVEGLPAHQLQDAIDACARKLAQQSKASR